MAGALADPARTALGTGAETLEGGSLISKHLGYEELIRAHVQIVFRVSNGGIEDLKHRLAGSLGSEGQYGLGFCHRLAPDQVDDDLDLAGGDADILGYRAGTLVGVGLARCALFS